MAEQGASQADNVVPLTEPPKEGGTQPAPGTEGEKGPSKNALKKAAKEKEKAEKAAKRAAAEEAQRKAAEANDVSKDDYGELPTLPKATTTPSSNDVQWISLPLIKEQLKDTDDAETEDGPHVMFQAVVENARSQSANLAFLVFKQGMSTIQAVVAKNETISKQVSTINASPNTEIRLIFDYRWSNLQLVYQLRP